MQVSYLQHICTTQTVLRPVELSGNNLSPVGALVVVFFGVGGAVEALVVVVSDPDCWVGGREDLEGVTEEVVGGAAVGVVAFFVVVGINWVVWGGLVVAGAGGSVITGLSDSSLSVTQSPFTHALLVP